MITAGLVVQPLRSFKTLGLGLTIWAFAELTAMYPAVREIVDLDTWHFYGTEPRQWPDDVGSIFCEALAEAPLGQVRRPQGIPP